ncbi:hypothetical protein SLS55_005945 [Diplodia seriata]|uniref:Arrestin domain-containing protein n=1 Tax=Diplodia seriata TaxID=420778 RepID=A0ABR3CCT9_9PEZI
MFATHEAKRRHGLKGAEPEPDRKKDEAPTLRLLRSQSAAVKRANTQWDLISSHEASFLVLLAGISNQQFIFSPHSRWRFDHLKIQNHLLRSIRESLASSGAKPSEIPESVIFAIAGLGCTVAVFNGDKHVATSHLAGARELIRLRGGMDTFQRFNRRAVIWCELHVCAAYQLRPTLAPAPPPWPLTTSPSPFPPAFAAHVSAAHARAKASYLPPPPPGKSEQQHQQQQLTRILAALTLVSASTTSPWQPAFQASAAAKEGVAAALDDAAHALLVEQARLLDRDDGDDGEEEGDWAHAVMLHAANAYLWAALTELPAHLQLHKALDGRLRGALEGGVAAGGWTRRRRRRGDGGYGDGAGGKGDDGAGALGVEALVWALVVGWFVAEKMEAETKQALGRAGGGEEMVGWFEERILELLRAEGIRDKERAARMIEDFPATDAFRRSWGTNTVQEQWIQQKDRVFFREVQLQAESEQNNECRARCWPFRIDLDAHMPETIDGLPFSYVRYFLTAEIQVGFWRRLHRGTRMIRVIKAPSFWAMDADLQELSADIWPNKISYQISSRRLYQTHEKEMAVYFLLTPLKHGTRIGPIHLDLVQTEVLTATRDGRPWRRDRTVTTIASTVASIPPDCKGELAVDRRSSLGDSDMRDESFSFAVKLPIDPAGYRRVQSVDDEKIKIRYTLKVCVDLLNPEGHLSKLLVDFHPKFFASIDNMEELSEHNSVLDGTVTPPLYGDHVFDEMLDADQDARTELPEYEDCDGLGMAVHF